MLKWSQTKEHSFQVMMQVLDAQLNCGVCAWQAQALGSIPSANKKNDIGKI